MKTPTLVLSDPAVSVSIEPPIQLRSESVLAPPGPPDGAATLAARELRRQVDRDVQAELALDAVSRNKDQDLAVARFRANQLSDQTSALQRDLSAKDEQLRLWRSVSAAGLVGSVVLGVLWLRTRKARVAAEQVDSEADYAYGYDSADDRLVDSKAHESGLLSSYGDSQGYASSQPRRRDAALRNSSLTLGEVWRESSIGATTSQTTGDQTLGALHGFSDTGSSGDSAAVRHASGTTAPGDADDVGPPSTKPDFLLDALAAAPAPDARSHGDLRNRLLDRGAEVPGIHAVGSTQTKNTDSAAGFEATALAATPEVFAAHVSVHAHLPDVQFIPQPMQDLLLLYRGLQEWGSDSRLGVAEQAFLHHIAEHQSTSGWVYLELLHLYRRKGERSSFDQWADAYRTRFNRLAPTWADAAHTGKELLRYDLATLQLSQAWSNDSVIWLLEQWLVGEPHMRRLMDIAAFREVFMLYELSLMVNDNPYAPIERVRRGQAQ